MTILSRFLKRFPYLVLSCLFCCIPAFANFFTADLFTSVSTLSEKLSVANKSIRFSGISSLAGVPPEAIDVKNFYLQSIPAQLFQLLPLIAKDSDGTITGFRIVTRPNNTYGKLYVNSTAINTNNYTLTLAEAKQLRFEPAGNNINQNVTFTFTAIDNETLTDASPPTFTIPITTNSANLVCSGTGLGNNILGADGTFSAPYITPNTTVNNCINDGSSIAAPLGNLGNRKNNQTTYSYASTSNSLGPEGTYSFLKTLGNMTTRNCIKTDWVASDHTGDGGYAMIVNGSPNSATYGKTFYQATSIAVCPNTLYEFSAYVINVLPGNHFAAQAGTEPNISFYINGQLVSTSGPIAYSTAAVNWVPQWVKVGGLWYSGPNTTTVDLRIDNATFVAGGNDLGLDDISMAICGPDITYPNIDLTAKFCSYGVLPLKADVKASINTYSAYIFQNSVDGGATWTDMGAPKIGSPVYNSGLNTYEYTAEYGDIPITPSMDGYRYRLKVATDVNNLIGTNCNVSADKIITVSIFNFPAGGADIIGCNPSPTAKLVAAGSGETWSIVAGNPVAAIIDQSGNVSGMTVNGIYKFQLTNTVGCSDTVKVVRDVLKNAGADVRVCAPETTIKLADAGTGYKWEAVAGNPAAATINPATGQVSGLSADGIYHFILRSDFGGCSDEVLVTMSSISLSNTKTDVLCFGSSTGAINLSVIGGTAPYTYAWTGGVTTEDLTGLAAGTYNVTVSDANNCTTTTSVIISAPAASLALASSKTDILCFGASTGAINLGVTGGTAPYTYAWTGGVATEDLTGLAAGTYNVTVTDANNCTATAAVIITQPAAALVLSSTKTDVLCFGASTGAINLSVTGGTAPYTYAWTGGVTTEDLTGLAAGTYNVTVTDANNCTATASVIITQPAAALALTTSKTDITCFGASSGAINLSVTGGTAPYTYAWTGGITTEDLTGLAAGTYNVTVTDANNCTATTSVIITEPAAALALTSSKTDVLCFGASTGAINLSVTGGTAPYTYAWTGGVTTEDLTGLAAGTYNVTVTDANNCTATAAVIITQPSAALALSSTKTDVLCFGASTGAINLGVTGGTAPYTYAWTGGVATEDLTGLAAGTYNVTVTDANNCTATTSVIISAPAAALALTSAKTEVLCFGASTGAINLSASGGTAPYTYAWSGGITTEDLTGLAAGTYNVTVTDAKNCTATASVIITQPAAALALTSSKTDVLCFGASNGAVNLSVSGGTAPYHFVWSGGETTEDLRDLAAGTYSVTVTDANKCTATATVIISAPAAALVLTSAKTDVLCFGTNTGAINLSVTGGKAPYTYSWTGGMSTEDLTGLAAGTYNVSVTDANNCTVTASVTISAPVAVLAISSTKTDVACSGSATGIINVNITGGYAPYTYSWDNGKTTKDLTNLIAGAYRVTVKDSKGCTAESTISISQPAALAVTTSKTNVSCYGSRTGAITLNIAGGTAPYTYQWSNGETRKDLSGIPSGNYKVIITDAGKCSVSAEVFITQPDPLKAILIAKNASCLNSGGAISANITGGVAPYKISWVGNPTMSASEISNAKAGIYEMMITDAVGCTTSAKAEILQSVCVPLAQNDIFELDQNKVLLGDVAPNDSKSESDNLTFTKLSDPKNGKITFDPNGSFTFVPDNGFTGNVEFTYQLCNSTGGCDTAKVSIEIKGMITVNLTPELSSVWEGRKVSITARLTKPFNEDVTVWVEYSGKAEKERDYLVLDQHMSIRIPKGSLSTTEKMTFAALNDGFQEGDEDIIVKIKTVSNQGVIMGSSAVVIINDVYPPPPPTDVPQDEPINAEIMPDALMSPNGDGNGNESFKIQNIEFYPDNEVLIFNRWGNALFAIKNYNNNDRNFKGYANKGLLVNSGLPLSDGVYFYIVTTYQAAGIERTKHVNKGYLILKR